MILLQESGNLARAMSRFSKPPPSATRPPLRYGKPYIFCAFPSNADRPDSPIRHIEASAPDTKRDTPGSAARAARSALVPALAAIFFLAILLPTTAQARHARHHHAGRMSIFSPSRSVKKVDVGRPRAWCGWYARTQVGRDPGPAFNLARNWARWGRPSGPGVGVMVVWSHHVGRITGRTADGDWIIKSGNDGHGVRERPRSIAGAIAFRSE